MSIRDHKEEFKRWLDEPDGTKVWTLDVTAGEWELSDNPKWDVDNIYIVDDEQAELRKQFIDDPSRIEFKDMDKGWTPTSAATLRDFTSLLWGRNELYRLKQKQWYEDIPDGGIWCWVWDDEASKGRYIYRICKIDNNKDGYKFLTCHGSYWAYAQPLDPQPEFKE